MYPVSRATTARYEELSCLHPAPSALLYTLLIHIPQVLQWYMLVYDQLPERLKVVGDDRAVERLRALRVER